MLSQISPAKILNPNYIFEANPNPDGLYLYLTFLFGIFFIIAVVLGVMSRRQASSIFKPLYSKAIYLFLTTGLLGLLFIFLRWQDIPYLGSRLMLVSLLVLFITWGGSIVFYKAFIFPKKRKDFEQKKRFEKYLPRPKTNQRAGFVHKEAV